MNAQEFRDLPDLERELLDLVGQVPPGRVSTYGTLATALGLAARGHEVTLLTGPGTGPEGSLLDVSGAPSALIKSSST